MYYVEFLNLIRLANDIWFLKNPFHKSFDVCFQSLFIMQSDELLFNYFNNEVEFDLFKYGNNYINLWIVDNHNHNKQINHCNSKSPENINNY